MEALPRLTVHGNTLRAGDAPGPVVLRGLNVSGLQHRRPASGQSWLDAAGVTAARLAWMAARGATIIRVPLSQDWVLGQDHDQAANSYLDAVDEAVTLANAHGLYVILCLHTLGWRMVRGAPTPYLPPLPDEDSAVFWDTIAARFAARSGVLFDLLNEPHGPEVAAWHSWVRRLRAVVDRHDPGMLTVVSGMGGPCWSSDLSSFPVRVRPTAGAPPLGNLIYSAHLYRHGSAWMTASRQTVNARGWRRLVEGPAAEHPIFIGEWGSGNHPRDAVWTAALLEYLEGLATTNSTTGRWRGLAGWTAWSVGDAPHIVQPGSAAAGAPEQPTAHGQRVLDALAQPSLAGSSRGTSR